MTCNLLTFVRKPLYITLPFWQCGWNLGLTLYIFQECHVYQHHNWLTTCIGPKAKVALLNVVVDHSQAVQLPHSLQGNQLVPFAAVYALHSSDFQMTAGDCEDHRADSLNCCSRKYTLTHQSRHLETKRPQLSQLTWALYGIGLITFTPRVLALMLMPTLPLTASTVDNQGNARLLSKLAHRTRNQATARRLGPP